MIQQGKPWCHLALDLTICNPLKWSPQARRDRRRTARVTARRPAEMVVRPDVRRSRRRRQITLPRSYFAVAEIHFSGECLSFMEPRSQRMAERTLVLRGAKRSLRSCISRSDSGTLLRSPQSTWRRLRACWLAAGGVNNLLMRSTRKKVTKTRPNYYSPAVH
jgi:hypothetical protein